MQTRQKSSAGLMGSRPNVKEPWQVICLDFIGPFPSTSSGHKYLLVVTDYFSKFVLMFRLRTATSKALTKIIEENVFLMFGVAQSVMYDNGRQMRS